MTTNFATFDSDQTHPDRFQRFVSSLEKGMTLICVLAFTNLFAVILNGPPSGTSEVRAESAIGRASWYLPYLLALLLAVGNWKRVLPPLPRIWPYIILFMIAVLSVRWSIDPALSNRRCIALFFTILIGYYLAVRAPLVDTLRLIGVAWLSLILIHLFFVIAVPSVGRHVGDVHDGAWRGILGIKNLLAGEMARAHVVFAALLFFDGMKKKIWLLGWAGSLLLILGTTSKTALLATIIAYAILVIYFIARRSVTATLIAVWMTVTGFSLVYFLLTNAADELVGVIGRDLTLTGRTDIWDAALEMIAIRPWTGFGYGAFWVNVAGPSALVRDLVGWEVPNAHNAWIEAAIGMGYPGMIMLAVTFILSLIKASWLMLREHGPWMFILLVQFMLYSFSESVLLEQNFNSSMVFAFVCCYALTVQGKRPISSVPIQATKLHFRDKAQPDDDPFVVKPKPVATDN